MLYCDFFKERKKKGLSYSGTREMKPRSPSFYPHCCLQTCCPFGENQNFSQKFYLQPEANLAPSERFHSCVAKNDLRFNQPLPFISEAKHKTLISSQGSLSKTSSTAQENWCQGQMPSSVLPRHRNRQNPILNMKENLISSKPIKEHFLRDRTLG